MRAPLPENDEPGQKLEKYISTVKQKSFCRKKKNNNGRQAPPRAWAAAGGRLPIETITRVANKRHFV
jgi:hypothetical protein